MQLLTSKVLVLLSVLYLLLLSGCVDSYDPQLPGNLDVVIVDGTINNLPEQQVIRLNRSKSDPNNGRPGFMALTKAKVQVIVDSAQVIEAHETVDGVYYLPADFRGQTGHAYQLRFTLSDGSTYESTQQVMPDVPLIGQVRVEFNPSSLSPTLLDGYTAAHDLYIDTQDPEGQPNYYKWDWKLWEKQEWCRTCYQGVYSINNVVEVYNNAGTRSFRPGNDLYEDCFYPPASHFPGRIIPDWTYDYKCRTKCWAVFLSTELNLFADGYTDGALIAKRKVAKVPFYQHHGCLVELRQSSLTPSAYRFFKDLQEQTQNSGGVADPPPTASIGNVQNQGDPNELVVGYFTASAVSTQRYWLDRTDTRGIPYGGGVDEKGNYVAGMNELFYAMFRRLPNPEPSPPNTPIFQIIDLSSRSRPYTAICVDSEKQTSYMPQGWRE
ncbi:DUF4249 domain-containing protein [Telluribacter sp.]|jgi:hypothetical protein|uniref:DUF4249 domain-containing protein n=1 Tax=Telluribacter sp. TaxID=1978767 RepID=UPI002E13EF34|nr:DUF4249 domain-containing protein [Telluribacter sp.]